MLTVLILSGQSTPSRLNNQPFQSKWVWTHYLHQITDFNLQPTTYGSLYPLVLTSSSTAPSRAEDRVQQMQDAGINGVQILFYGNEDPTGVTADWMTMATQHPGFVVAPCIDPDTEDQAVRLVQLYATVANNHASAAKENGKLVIFTYGARYGKTPDFWQHVRARLNSANIATFLVNDTDADLGVHGGLQPGLLTPYFPMFDASYMFDDLTQNYWGDILLLFNQYNHAYAGGVMPEYNLEVTNGGYTDARATEHYRRDWELGLNAGLRWQTVVTWNDYVEHTLIRPSSDWNWTRADITAFYSAKLRGTPFPNSSPQLYVTTPQMIRLGKAPHAEGLILNSSNSTMTVKIQLFDGNEHPYGDVRSASVPPYAAGDVTIPDSSTIDEFPSGRFLRAQATMYDANTVQLSPKVR